MAGGARLTEGGLACGYFVAPTVFAGVRDDMRSACKKTFAPVLSARLFADSADAIMRAKASVHGLGSGVWSHNVSTVHRVARRLRTGTVWANGYLVMDPAVPFGGAKMSSFGHECGPDHRHEYLQTRAVLIQLDQGAAPPARRQAWRHRQRPLRRPAGFATVINPLGGRAMHGASLGPLSKPDFALQNGLGVLEPDRRRCVFVDDTHDVAPGLEHPTEAVLHGPNLLALC